MKSLTDTYKLLNGVKIPCIGFGTWQVEDGEEAVSSVKSALEVGYRHIDTAQGYDNEGSVGTAVKQSGIDRKDIFITSKLTNTVRGYQQTLDAIEESMKKLQTDYVDLFLIHWPNPAGFRDNWEEMNAESWRAFEELYHQKHLRAIGISNFHPHHIAALMRTATVVPMVNQIRLCPGETQDEVVDYSRAQGMLLEAYSPLGVGKIFDVPELKELAKKYDKTIAQIAIRWSLQRGYLPLPKSVNDDRIKENAEVFDFELNEEDVQLIADLKGCAGYSDDPDKVSW
ncbi:MAG: aldo/keto reductase [Clostridiales bacterium]|nr:aldo/keto reductase [Clostridiales bacterium]